eukprot:1960177-Prymnesium_polylepis.1
METACWQLLAATRCSSRGVFSGRSVRHTVAAPARCAAMPASPQPAPSSRTEQPARRGAWAECSHSATTFAHGHTRCAVMAGRKAGFTPGSAALSGPCVGCRMPGPPVALACSYAAHPGGNGGGGIWMVRPEKV